MPAFAEGGEREGDFMKKLTRKLTLSRETLRTLGPPTLTQAVAGHDTTKTTETLLLTCPTNCDITMGCELTNPC